MQVACRISSIKKGAGDLSFGRYSTNVKLVNPAVQFASSSPASAASLILELDIFFTRSITSLSITFLSFFSYERAIVPSNRIPLSIPVRRQHQLKLLIPPTKILGHLALGTKSLDTTIKLTQAQIKLWTRLLTPGTNGSLPSTHKPSNQPRPRTTHQASSRSADRKFIQLHFMRF